MADKTLGKPGTAPGGQARRGSLSNSLGWFIGGSGISFIGYIGVSALVGRLLGSADFGYFAIAFSATTVLGEMALIGVHRTGVREAARLIEGDNQGLSQLRSGVKAVSLVTLPLVGLTAAVVTWWLLPADTAQGNLVVSIEVGALVVLNGHQSLWANFLRGFGHVRFAGLLEGRSGGAIVALVQCCLLGVLLAVAPNLGLGGALGAVALSYLLPVVLAAHVVSQHWSRVAPSENTITALKSVVRRDWRFASARWGGAISTNIQLWMAGWLLTGVELSWFGAAQRLATLLTIPLVSIATVFSPAVSRLYAGGDKGTLERLIRTGGTATVAVVFATAAPLLVIPGVVLSLVYGQEFAAAATVLVLLCLGPLTSALVGLTGTVMSMTHREGVQAKLVWIGLVARIVLGVAATHAFGMIGLAASAAIITSAVTSSVWLYIRRDLGINSALTFRPSLRLLRETRG